MATMGEMAAGIAHELNQPLSAIATYARACERFLNSATAGPAGNTFIARGNQPRSHARRRNDPAPAPAREQHPSDRVPTQMNDLVRDLGVLMQADARVHRTHIEFELEPDSAARARGTDRSSSRWC